MRVKNCDLLSCLGQHNPSVVPDDCVFDVVRLWLDRKRDPALIVFGILVCGRDLRLTMR